MEITAEEFYLDNVIQEVDMLRDFLLSNREKMIDDCKNKNLILNLSPVFNQLIDKLKKKEEGYIETLDI